MVQIASPGHKLGQMIGNFFEELFAEDLIRFCAEHGVYCDRRGPRPKVRGSSKKVTWTDKFGNKHDLDYVIEKGGSVEQKGIPVAFVELAWRRYTKHSRNKTGELEGSLLHLRDTYQSCQFLGVILAGEYTEGGKGQLISHGITVLHVPFKVLAQCFRHQGVELDYPENATPDLKRSVIKKWNSLDTDALNAIKSALRNEITSDYASFMKVLEDSLLRKVYLIRVMPLYGTEMVFQSVSDAVSNLTNFLETDPTTLAFVKFEVQVRFSNGDQIEGRFSDKTGALEFLSMFS